MRRREFLKDAALVSVSILASNAGAEGDDTTSNSGDQKFILKNDHLAARFNDKGLVQIMSKKNKRTYAFSNDNAIITVGGVTYDTSRMAPSQVNKSENVLSYLYSFNGNRLTVQYELNPDWLFLSKQLIFEPADATYHVNDITVFKADIHSDISHENRIYDGSRGAFLRLAPNDTAKNCGILLTLQNPMINWTFQNGVASLAYTPDMEWDKVYGPFESDRAIIAPYELSGTEYPAGLTSEWQYLPDPETAGMGGEMIDMAEVSAFAGAVRAFLVETPRKTISIHVGWTENDYQIDCGTEAGRTEYKRIIDRASQLGIQNILYAPANSQVSSLDQNTDAWGWENVLWFGLGQKIRKGEWIPGKDPIPPSIKEMLDYAKNRKVKLVAYAYPSLGFMQNLKWTNWCNHKTGGYVGVDTGNRSFQDWFVDQLVAFHEQTGSGGFSFDHWWIAYDKPATSKYAQWHGCRRILENLRKRAPGIVIDGRQQYQWFGPWTWVGGNYPHPFGNDEQPESFTAHPDLHTDRVSAFHQRAISWNYRMVNFAPVEVTPGYMTHQTQRFDAKGVMHRDEWRTRDWDLLGWRYSVLSSIATGPINNVVDFLPARDMAEYRTFPRKDIIWLKNWIAWTERNFPYMKRMRPILGQPLIGRVDGTSAIIGDTGYIFLFNPNYRAMNATFRLDGGIGLENGDSFMLEELDPLPGRKYGKPREGFWKWGDTISIPMLGTSAIALRIYPSSQTTLPITCNAAGDAILTDGQLKLTNVRGEFGSERELMVMLPYNAWVNDVSINGKRVTLNRSMDLVNSRVKFNGDAFYQAHQVGKYDPEFSGGRFHGEFTIPERIFAQLIDRKKNWTVQYTEDDLLAPWLGPDRLYLFVDIAEPNPNMNVEMTINGKNMEVKKAWNGVYPNSGNQTFLGFYADIASLLPGVPYHVELTLPDNLKPGQFQGLYFDNVETEYTDEIA